MEEQLDRIASAFERMADALQEISNCGLTIHGEIDRIGSVHAVLEDMPPMLVKLEPYERAFKVELSNCTDTETPFDIQIHD